MKKTRKASMRVSPPPVETQRVVMNTNHTTNRPRRAEAILVLLVGSVLASGCALFRKGEEAVRTPLHEPAELAEAIEWSARQAQLAPDEPYFPHRLAELHLRAGRGDDAELALRSALARDPKYAPALSLLSRLLYEDGRHEEGVELLEAVPIGSFPGEEAVVLAAGLALHREALGKTDLARQTLAPYRAELDWERLGSVPTYLELRGDRFLDAASLAERALKARQDAINLNNHGISRLLAGDPEAARDEFQRAHTLDPVLPGPLYNLAIVERFYFFDDAAAQDYFERYAALSSEDPDGLRTIFQTETQSRVVREREGGR